MKNIKELRQSTSERMKRCWGENCALFFISAGGITAALFAGYLVMNFFVAIGVAERMNEPLVLVVAAVIFLLMWIIAVPYKYGARWYRLQQARGHSVHAKSVFSCYFSSKRLMQVYKLSILLTLRKFILLIPFLLFISSALVLIIYISSEGGGAGQNIAVVVLIMLAVCAYLAYTVLNMKYAAAPFLFALGHDRPARDIINESIHFMKGTQRYMIEMLRTCGIMLIPCIMFFPMVFIVPRVTMLYTAAINEIIENGFAKDKLVDMERRV